MSRIHTLPRKPVPQSLKVSVSLVSFTPLVVQYVVPSVLLKVLHSVHIVLFRLSRCPWLLEYVQNDSSVRGKTSTIPEGPVTGP